MNLLLILIAQVIFADPRFQLSWNQTNGINGIKGWNVAVMDRGTVNVRSKWPTTTNAMMLTTGMFPGAGLWDLRVNTFTATELSTWSRPITINWTPIIISPPRNFRILTAP